MEGELAGGEGASIVEGDLLARLRALITEKTRFDGSAIASATMSTATQGYAVGVVHSFRVDTQSASIDGHTVPSGAARCANPASQAATEGDANMRHRMMTVRQKIEAAPNGWDVESDGVVKPGTTYYELHGCGHCNGQGSVRCGECSGSGEQTCSSCGGTGHTRCFTCSGSGQQSCRTCNGRGYLEEYVGLGQAPAQRSCSTCYGRRTVQCSSCSGRGQNDCSSCYGRGRRSCISCGGSGKRQCTSCAGSGQVGASARSDVLHSTAATLTWHAQDSDAEGIGNRFHATGVRAQSSSFILDRGSIAESSDAIVSRYDGKLAITHMDAVCNERHYRLTAFGTKQIWYDLGTLVTDLLTPDVEALRSQVLEVDGAGWFSKRVHELSPLVHQIIKSEINVQLVDALITGNSDDQLDAVAGEDYRLKLQQVLGPALRRIYRFAGRESLWPVSLVALLIAVAGWWFGMAWVGIVAALCAIPVSLWLFDWRAKAVLRRSLESKERAVQAVGLVKKMHGHRTIYALHALPALVIAALAIAGALNPRSVAAPSTPRNTVASIASPVRSTVDAARVPNASNQPASLGQALALLNHHQFGQARTLLQPLAAHGDTRAYLPLAKALMRDDSGAYRNTSQIHMTAAEGWARKAAEAFPKSADAAYIAGLAASSGLGKKSDMTVANQLFRRSAALGNTDAMTALGLSYINGTGVPQSDAQARHWYTTAADGGNAAAMFNVGLMDWQGRGISAPDHAGALTLWRKAAAAGSTRAKQALAQLHQPST